MDIGSNIRALRKERGMTQETLAEFLNVSVAAISKWETQRGIPELKMIINLATIFNVSLDRLIGYENIVNDLDYCCDNLKVSA